MSTVSSRNKRSSIITNINGKALHITNRECTVLKSVIEAYDNKNPRKTKSVSHHDFFLKFGMIEDRNGKAIPTEYGRSLSEAVKDEKLWCYEEG